MVLIRHDVSDLIQNGINFESQEYGVSNRFKFYRMFVEICVKEGLQCF